ncbi:MAG TPA: glycine/betaine ABC transporter [Eubacteriaceae bacterium]|nr:glycine/betaine ABC transporter [Eubacteriaceae bacterium]
MFKKSILLVLIVSMALFAFACGNGDEGGTVELGYVAWDSEIASTNVLKTVLEDEGFDVNITAVEAGPLYQGVADGDFDAMVSAWLPGTHGDYIDEFGDEMVDLGANLEGAKIGLVVPADAPVDSIADLDGYANNEITGIAPGAGVMQAAAEAIDVYGIDYELLEGSDPIMAQALEEAMDTGGEVIVTGWTPHWKFARWDLKYLDDPEGVFGGEEFIGTFARQGFEEDNPEAFKIIDNFEWTADDMASVMIAIQEGTSEEEAAREWVDNNQDKVSSWVE